MDDLKRHARLVYRFFALGKEVRSNRYAELNSLCDAHRWQEAELLLGRLERA